MEDNMASEPPLLPPGTGAYRPERDSTPGEPRDHMRAWNIAIQNALDNIGRAPGRYDVTLVLSGTVEIQNPGNVIEYVAKFS
jgi:hypothetical protein